ncbi:hypothetical protein B6S09_11230 [Oceanimonas baumannii]|uniref:DUF4113 domain-containing protein n=1 Tax=Oceanimonas baumannii TaxID=129578 RepID=A0A235CI29_9GAMM|nr:hypothetical protein B6S09_11230 [Oceanimonas baumannii]
MFFAGEGISKAWKIKKPRLSPAYTTRVDDIPVVS